MFSRNTRSVLFDKTFEFMLNFSSCALEDLDSFQIKREFEQFREEAFALLLEMERVTPEHIKRHTPALVAEEGGGGNS